MDYIQTRELYHHGIKGQKWGVRRFMNEDGTLTPEGQRRYNPDGSKKTKKQIEAEKQARRDDILEQFNDELRKMPLTSRQKDFNEWKRKHPKADDDDYDDQLTPERAEELDKQDKEWDAKYGEQYRKLSSDAYKLRSDYVKYETITGIVSSVALLPAAALIGGIGSIFVKGGKKKAAVALGTIGTLSAAPIITEYVKARKERSAIDKKYNI